MIAVIKKMNYGRTTDVVVRSFESEQQMHGFFSNQNVWGNFDTYVYRHDLEDPITRRDDYVGCYRMHSPRPYTENVEAYILRAETYEAPENQLKDTMKDIFG